MNRQTLPPALRPSLSWPVIALLAVLAAVATLVGLELGVDRFADRGTYTGEFTSGGPVYRLPAIFVVADRKTELARIEREERREQAKAKAGRPAA